MKSFRLTLFSCLSLFGLFFLSSLPSCKSIDSSTSARFNINNESIPVDKFQYIDITNVYTMDEGRTSRQVNHRYAIAEKQEDNSFIFHFATSSNHIPSHMNYLIDYFPSNVKFRALAIPHSNGNLIIYGSKTDNISNSKFATRNRVSEYKKSDFNIPIGLAYRASGDSCNNVNINSSRKVKDILTDECIIIEELCNNNFSKTCKLIWDQFGHRYGLPYHIKSIELY